MSKLILDVSSPNVAEMISGWQEGGQYYITLNVTQGKTSGSLVEFDVDEVTDYGDAESATEESVEDVPVPPVMERKNGQPKEKAKPESSTA